MFADGILLLKRRRGPPQLKLCCHLLSDSVRHEVSWSKSEVVSVAFGVNGAQWANYWIEKAAFSLQSALVSLLVQKRKKEKKTETEICV